MSIVVTLEADLQTAAGKSVRLVVPCKINADTQKTLEPQSWGEHLVCLTLDPFVAKTVRLVARVAAVALAALLTLFSCGIGLILLHKIYAQFLAYEERINMTLTPIAEKYGWIAVARLAKTKFVRPRAVVMAASPPAAAPAAFAAPATPHPRRRTSSSEASGHSGGRFSLRGSEAGGEWTLPSDSSGEESFGDGWSETKTPETDV